jgi:hypothetical protein
VSSAEKIAKLEALLARVVSRAGEPRRRPNAFPVAPAAFEAAPPVAVVEIDEVDEATIPPPPMAPVRAPAPTEAEVVMEVDLLPDGAVDTVIGVAAEEVVVAESLGSRERLVAAAPVPPPSPAPVAEPEAPLLEVPSLREVAELEESPPELLAAVEEVEEAPLSSRRPVAPEPEERLADLAFGAEEPAPPRHTPPPESGRLPAVPAVEFDGDVTGVREATPIVSRPRELVPEATRPALAPSDAVADLVGAAQRFAPASFAELLDASLAL